MQVGDPTIPMSGVTPSEIQPTPRVPVRPADGRAAERNKRGGPQNDRRADFRAVLDAVAGGTGNAFAQPLAADSQLGAQEARPEKRPSGDVELDGTDTPELLNASQSTARNVNTAAFSQPYRAMTREYAQAFFSVAGTFAARGDNLEISA